MKQKENEMYEQLIMGEPKKDILSCLDNLETKKQIGQKLERKQSDIFTRTDYNFNKVEKSEKEDPIEIDSQ